VGKTAPAVFGLLAALELHPTNKKAGVFAPIGGFQAVSQAFEKLALDSGVEIMYQMTVTEVTRDGVWLLNDDDSDSTPQFMKGDCMVINADLPYAIKSLMRMDGTGDTTSKDGEDWKRGDRRYDWDDTLEYSSGVIAFHWSIDNRTTCDELNTHNVFMVASSRKKMEDSWSAVRCSNVVEEVEGEGGFDPESFNFYVHRASVVDETAAPKNCDAVMALVPCRSLLRDRGLSNLPRDQCIAGYKETYNDEYVGKIRDAVLTRLAALEGLDDLRSHIVDEVVDTPGSYADLYNVAAGSPFALSHGFGQLSLTRPGHRSNDADNVFFVGASTRPGNGVPLVLIGAKQLARKVLQKINNTVQDQR